MHAFLFEHHVTDYIFSLAMYMSSDTGEPPKNLSTGAFVSVRGRYMTAQEKTGNIPPVCV